MISRYFGLKYHLFILVLALGAFSIAKAQPTRIINTNTEIPQQSVYAELGGNGLIYSLNYDVLFQSDWGFRLGGAYFPFYIDDEDEFTFKNTTDSFAFVGLVIGQRTFGKTAHKLEIGTGLLFGTIYDPDKWGFLEPPGATFSLGYRYYPFESSRFTFKAAFTPVINRTGFHPRIGISFGITLTPEGNVKNRSGFLDR